MVTLGIVWDIIASTFMAIGSHFMKETKQPNRILIAVKCDVDFTLKMSLVITVDYRDAGVMSQSIPTGYIPPRRSAQKHCPGGRDLTFESCPGAGNSTRAGILWKFKVKHFVCVLVLSVINIWCPKNS